MKIKLPDPNNEQQPSDMSEMIENDVQIEIYDTGLGIKKEDQNKIFFLFGKLEDLS